MAKSPFPWLPEEDQEEKVLKEIEDFDRRRLYVEKLKSLAPLLLLCAVLFFMILSNKNKELQNNKKATQGSLEVLVSMLPIPKGNKISFETIKLIRINPRSLSKNQKLQRLRPEDAHNLQDKLYAKKNIPPHKPLFWNEVHYKETQKSKQKKPLKIYFSGKI